jgi:hypothetical protein
VLRRREADRDEDQIGLEIELAAGHRP